MIVSIVGTVTLIPFIERDHFAHDFDNWLASVVVWISNISWLTASVVSGGLYYILRPILAADGRAEAAVTH